MSNYNYAEISSLNDWTPFVEDAWNRCVEESWDSLEESMDWTAFARMFYNDNTVRATDYTTRQQKDWLRQDIRKGITDPRFKTIVEYKDGYITKFLKTRFEEKENGNRLDIIFLVVGRDLSNSKRFVNSDTEIIEQRKAFRQWSRLDVNNIKEVHIHLCNDGDHAMKRHFEAKYKNASSVDSVDETTLDDSLMTRTEVVTNHTLPDNDDDL